MAHKILTWLHVSDIHFGHGRAARHRVDQRIICDEILRDAGEMVDQLGPPDRVFITGDVAFKGDPEQEYPQATEWLSQLLKTVHADASRLYLVPGNHDVDRRKATKPTTRRLLHEALRNDPTGLDEFLEQPEELAQIWPKLEAYANFAEPYAGPSLTPAQPFWTCPQETTLGKLVLVGLNTNLLSFDNDDSPANLALGSHQLQQAIHAQPREALLLVLQHHPPDWLTDGPKLRTLLQDRAHVLLCGHVHTQGGLTGFPLHGHGLLELVAGAGHADPGMPAEHAYAWGQLSSDGLAYFPRTWVERQHRFRPDRNSFATLGEDGAVRLEPTKLPAALGAWLPTAESAPPPARQTATSAPAAPPPATRSVQDRLTSEPEPPKPDLQAATAEYLRYFKDRHQYLSFKGMGLSERVPLQLPLLDLYVPLQARQEMPAGETWDRSLRLAGRDLSEEEQQAMAGRLGEPQPVLELLQKHDGLIVLGDPGAGKTTFLKYLTLKLAQGDGAELGLGDRLPILVPLSGFANRLEEADVRLDDFIAEHFHTIGSDLPTKALLDDALERGAALVLLDGLDEVSDNNLRHLVVERVVDFYTLRRQAGNKFVLSSRIIGYREVRPTAPGLMECTLVDFDDEEIEAFVARWTAALEKQAQGDTRLAQADAKRERQELLEAVKRNPGVRQLASNPLLLTILALMKRQGVTLPERRVELYDQYVKTLLSSWNRARGLGRPPTHDLDPVQTVKILAPLALWMHETNPGVGLVKREDLRRELEALYQRRGESDPEACARQFLNDVREYAGLLLERGPGEYGFIHLTFEEYLSAVAIALQDQRDPKTAIVRALSAHIGEPAWHEIGLLTVGYVGLIQQLDQIAGDVVETLVEEQPGEPGAAVVLAGEAVLDACPVGVPTSSKARVIQALIETMQAAEVPATLRRRAGLALGRLDWLPDDLDSFVAVPAGRFLYGEGKREREIPHPYWITKYPVTNEQYARFIEDGGYEHEEFWGEAGRKWRQDQNQKQPYYWDRVRWNNPLFPVVAVTWYEAEAYCNWLTHRVREKDFSVGAEQVSLPEGYAARLPTEEEWERAARGTDGREYPWGEAFALANTNIEESEAGGTTAVCTYPQGESPTGAWDMGGNVWEWTILPWSPDDDWPVIRGGSWGGDERSARCASRGRGSPRRRVHLRRFSGGDVPGGFWFLNCWFLTN